jgi:hypothetical protein
LLISLLGRTAVSDERTIPIAEVRQRFERVKAAHREPDSAVFYRKVDDCLTALEKQYGAEVPMTALVKAISDLKNAVPGPAKKTGAPVSGPPDGIRIERTPVGFVVRIAAGSFGYAITWLVFAGVLAVLPFRLGAEINRESFHGGQGIGWTLWAAGVLVLAGAAAFAWFHQIRITKTGDHGEIFSGLGPLGRTHRFEWSGFSDVRDHEFARYTGARSTRTGHDVQLAGASESYRFGEDLGDAPRAFLVAFLRREALGRDDAPGTGRIEY